MVKFIALAATLLAGSASAFTAPSNGRANMALSAEKSQSLPFMNRPALVSLIMLHTAKIVILEYRLHQTFRMGLVIDETIQKLLTFSLGQLKTNCSVRRP